jgi:hypothetical protein
MRPLWPAAAALLAVGCGTTPVPSSSAKPIPASRIHAPDFTEARQGLALLVVTRDKGLSSKACVAQLYVDGTLIADLRPSEQIRLYVDEGEHVVGVNAEGTLCFGGADQTPVTVTRARPVLLRVSAGHGAGMTIERSPF